MKGISLSFQRFAANPIIPLILLCTFLGFGYNLQAQTPQTIWARQIGGTDLDYGMAITVDNTGNIYTTGSFKGTVDFDPGSGIDNLSSTAGSNGDIYINKLNPEGHLIWAKRFAGNFVSNSNIGMAIITDSKNNLYVAGAFTGTVDFDPGQDTFSLTSTGGINGFLAKLSPEGDLLWVKRMGGSTVYSHCDPLAMALNSYGDVILTGKFYQTINFNPGGTAENQSSGNNAANIFIAKFTKDGVFSWVKNIGGTGNDIPYSIALDAADNIYTTGGFGQSGNTVDFDPGTGVFNLTSMGSFSDVFVLKLDKDGNFVWAKQISSTEPEEGISVVTDKLGHLYVAGTFNSLNLDLNPNQGTDIVIAKFIDVFLVKLDTAGNFIYGKRYGGSGIDKVVALAADSTGNLFMAGRFTDTTDFSAGNSSGMLVSAGLEDSYLAKLDSSGELQWIRQISGIDYEWYWGMALSNTGSIYTVGNFENAAHFGINGGDSVLNSHGDFDIFIEKVAECAPTETVSVSGITYVQHADTLTFSSNGLTNVFYYYWDFGDGTTSDDQNPAHVFLQAGDYTVTLVVSNDCHFDTVSTTIHYDPTAIKNVLSGNGSLKLYPNPAKESLMLEANNHQIMEDLSVYNGLGQKVASFQRINSSHYILDTHLLPPGFYVMSVSFNDKTIAYGRFQKID